MQRQNDGSGVTEFGSFDNNTCKRVLDLLEPGDLRLGAEVVIKRVAVVELGVNSGSGGCFGIEVWTDTVRTRSVQWQRVSERCVSPSVKTNRPRAPVCSVEC